MAMPQQSHEQTVRRSARAAPSRAARTVAVVAVALGLGSLAYRLLHATNLDQTAALFVGIPSLLAFAAAFVALRMHVDGIMGITVKTITIGLLLSGPVLVEGFICVLLAAPLFYAVGMLVALAIRTGRKLSERRQTRGAAGLLLLPLLAFSFEGTMPGTTVLREATSTAERTVLATPAEVEAALTHEPHFDVPLGPLLSMGFPKPADARGQGLVPGDQRTITFVTGSGRQRDLVMQVVARGPDWVRFQPVSDSTKIAELLGWRSADVSWTDLGDGKTLVRWSLSYDRRLDPSWYFGPWENLVTTLAADYLILSAATPAA